MRGTLLLSALTLTQAACGGVGVVRAQKLAPSRGAERCPRQPHAHGFRELRWTVRGHAHATDGCRG